MPKRSLTTGLDLYLKQERPHQTLLFLKSNHRNGAQHGAPEKGFVMFQFADEEGHYFGNRAILETWLQTLPEQ